MKAGYGGWGMTGDTGEGMFTLVVELMFEHLMPEMNSSVCMVNNLVNNDIIIKIKSEGKERDLNYKKKDY